MITTTTEPKSLLPEIRVVGKRFIIQEKVGSTPKTQGTLDLGDVDASRDVERPVEKTGVIPKHVWG